MPESGPIESSESGFSTQLEMMFLDGLGFNSGGHTCSRDDLLRKYISSCERRVRWDGINKAKVISYARALLG